MIEVAAYISPPPTLTVELRLPENRYIFFYPEIVLDKGNVEFEFEACDWLNIYTATGLAGVSAMFKSQKILPCRVDRCFLNPQIPRRTFLYRLMYIICRFFQGGGWRGG